MENDIEGYLSENRLLHQATQKFEKQLAQAHAQNDSLQRTFQHNERSYQEKVNRIILPSTISNRHISRSTNANLC